tara:strand:- start:952 stop:1617 length:666 start_codon:yes stop_codon:yes gene_type:complete
MKFDTEIELVNVLKSTLNECFPRQDINIFQEVSLGYGIADLVICVRDDKFCDKSFHLSRAILDKCDINIYYLIDRKPKITLLEIIEITRTSKMKIFDSLKKLVNSEYIDCIDGCYVISRSYEFSFNMNFAIEAKLKDWKRALKQAYRYKWFAEFAFVVLDEHNSSSALKNLLYFEKYNVGLATINRNGVLKRLHNPKRDVPFDKKMQMLFSEKFIFSSAIC